MSQRFFVYDLIDPRDDKVFYVGKGQKQRPYDHEREALKGVQSEKCDRIREILESGNSVKIDIVKRFSDETEAYQFEAERVEQIGLANLTNVIPGGMWGRQGLSGEPVKRLSNACAEILARALRYIDGGNRIVLFGKYDVTEGVNIALNGYVKSMGIEAVSEKLAKHNVRLVYVPTT
jgi:hypothetical protein